MSDRKPEDTRTQKERMLAGELYLADDPELEQASRRAYRLMKEYEARYAVDRNEAIVVLKELLQLRGRDPRGCERHEKDRLTRQ